MAVNFEKKSLFFKLKKILKNHAALLEFFFAYYLEQNKYESTSNKNVIQADKQL